MQEYNRPTHSIRSIYIQVHIHFRYRFLSVLESKHQQLLYHIVLHSRYSVHHQHILRHYHLLDPNIGIVILSDFQRLILCMGQNKHSMVSMQPRQEHVYQVVVEHCIGHKVNF